MSFFSNNLAAKGAQKSMLASQNFGGSAASGFGGWNINNRKLAPAFQAQNQDINKSQDIVGEGDRISAFGVRNFVASVELNNEYGQDPILQEGNHVLRPPLPGRKFGMNSMGAGGFPRQRMFSNPDHDQQMAAHDLDLGS